MPLISIVCEAGWALKSTWIFWIKDDSFALVAIQILDLPVRNLGTTRTTLSKIFHHSTSISWPF